MTAKIIFEIKITDDDFANAEQKQLFLDADEESRQICLRDKAEELKSDADVVLPIKYEI